METARSAVAVFHTGMATACAASHAAAALVGKSTTRQGAPGYGPAPAGAATVYFSCPASAATMAPVMMAARGLAMNTAMSAASSGLPNRCSAVSRLL